MHATERESLILQLISVHGFVSFRDFKKHLEASPATIRRDLERLSKEKRIFRVRGGAMAGDGANIKSIPAGNTLVATPFSENIRRNLPQKKAIAQTAAGFCKAGEGVMIDGGTTTFLMCPHLAGLNLQVLTNSLHIIGELINQRGTRLLVPAGTVFPEQNIILSAFGEDGMPKFHAPKVIMGAGSIGPQGLMQRDVILVAAERLFIERAEEVIVIADATKFGPSSGNVVCGLDQVDKIVTDDRVDDATVQMMERAGVQLIIADNPKVKLRAGA